jgi:putative ABC transport system permease protein
MWTENLHDAFRGLRSTPGFTATAILSLSIGIGGSVSMFTVVNSILLKPLAYSDSGRLVRVTNTVTAKNSAVYKYSDMGVFPLQFTRWRGQVQSLDSIALVRFGNRYNLTWTGRPEEVGVMRVSAEYFETLGVQPQLGRWFREAEEKRGTSGVAILSDSCWRRTFSARPDIIGQMIRINDAPSEVVGVAPSNLRFFRNEELGLPMPNRIDVILPIRFTPQELQGSLADDQVAIARLKNGITPEQARAELDSTLNSIPEYRAAFADLNARVHVQELQAVVVRDVRTGLLLLMLSVGLVMLIACVNVANLSLVRATQRSRELAVRAALGASRRDLIRYSLAESLIIALAGTIAGSILSLWITDLAVSRAPLLPRAGEVVADFVVFGFAVGTCVLTTVLFGLLPACKASRADPMDALKAAGRGKTDTRRGGRIRATLIAAEVALGTVLVIGSGLLLSSFHRVMNSPRGFDGHDVLIADLLLPSSKYQAVEKQVAFYRALHDDLAAIPGVSRVAANTRPPLDGEAPFSVLTEGATKRLSQLPWASWPNVTSGYFAAMRIPLRGGRLFRDAGETEPVAVVSESAARMLWPGQDPIGKRVNKFSEARDDYSRIIGVVGDVLSGALDRPPTPAVYRPYNQRGGRTAAFTLIVQTTVPPATLITTIRNAVSRLDPDLPVSELRPMSALIASSVQPRLFQAALLGAFAFVAVLLAAIGIHGVVAYSVLQRRKEIGVRIAVGADQQNISQLVFRNGMTPVVFGLSAGLLASVFITKLMTSLLFQVRALDPAAFITAPSVLTLAAALPCFLTARQAARIDPIDALRSE